LGTMFDVGPFETHVSEARHGATDFVESFRPGPPASAAHSSNALGVAEILDRDGNAVKWPTISSCLNLLESRAGVCQSMFAHDGVITLQPGIDLCDAIQHHPGQIDRRQVVRLDSPPDFPL